MKSKIIAIVCCSTAFGAAPRHAGADETIDQRQPAAEHGTVQITATGGLIECVGWDKPEVELSGELSGGAQRLDVQREGDTINIRVVTKSPSVHWSSDTHLKVKLPTGSGVRISAVGADANVKGITGEQHVQTVSGNIETDVVTSDVDLKTLSGDVKVHGKGGNLHLALSTVSGNVTVRNVGGDLDFDTVSGDVDVQLATVNRAKFKAISGDLRAAGKLGNQAHVEVSSVSGDLGLRFNGSEAANIDAESFSGDISSCIGNVPVMKPSFGPGQSWHYSPAGGSADMRVKSMSGDIVVCNK